MVISKKTPKKRATTVAKGVKLKRGTEEKLRRRPGGGSTGKYKTVAKGDFAGKAGGTSPFSFPINTIKRARNALARAHFAPNPAGIKRAVYRKWPALKKRKEARSK